MPNLTSRIKEVGQWSAIVTLLVVGAYVVKVGSDERTIANRLKLAETELSREREASDTKHALSLADRTVTKSNQQIIRDTAERNAVRIAALEARITALENARRAP